MKHPIEKKWLSLATKILKNKARREQGEVYPIIKYTDALQFARKLKANAALI